MRCDINKDLSTCSLLKACKCESLGERGLDDAVGARSGRRCAGGHLAFFCHEEGTGGYEHFSSPAARQPAPKQLVKGEESRRWCVRTAN